MSGWNKSKRASQHIYVDRSKVLKESNRQPNVASGVIASPCIDKQRTGSLQRHFKHMINSADKEPCMLTAMVMHNDICVLVIESKIEAVSEVKFMIDVDADLISGKKKKGAKKVKAGSSLLLLTFADGSVTEYITPVGGQLLETNLNLLSHPNLLQDQPCGTGYIAVIYPDTEIPNLTNGLIVKSSSDQPSLQDKKSNICFAFVKGICSRGDNCKFKHDTDDAHDSKKQRRENCLQNDNSSISEVSGAITLITDKPKEDETNIAPDLLV